MPTRGRLRLAKRAIESIRDTSAGKVEIILGVDEPEAGLYASLGVPMVVFEVGHGGSWKTNQLAPHAAGDAMMCGHDDLIWRTPGWDRKFLDLLAEEPLQVLYFKDDPVRHRGLVEPVVSRKWYELGGFYPAHFHHFLGDEWVKSIAEDVGRLRYVPSVVIEHCHPKHNKGEQDETYLLRCPHSPAKSHEQERQEIIQRIRQAIG